MNMTPDGERKVDPKQVHDRLIETGIINAADLCSVAYHDYTRQLAQERILAAETAVKERRANFDDLTILEPRLQWLAQDADAFRRKYWRRRFAWYPKRWYGSGPWDGRGLKGRMSDLVGWEANRGTHRLLHDGYCYDLAYEYLTDLLIKEPAPDEHGVEKYLLLKLVKSRMTFATRVKTPTQEHQMENEHG